MQSQSATGGRHDRGVWRMIEAVIGGAIVLFLVALAGLVLVLWIAGTLKW